MERSIRSLTATTGDNKDLLVTQAFVVVDKFSNNMKKGSDTHREQEQQQKLFSQSSLPSSTLPTAPRPRPGTAEPSSAAAAASGVSADAPAATVFMPRYA